MAGGVEGHHGEVDALQRGLLVRKGLRAPAPSGSVAPRRSATSIRKVATHWAGSSLTCCAFPVSAVAGRRCQPQLPHGTIRTTAGRCLVCVRAWPAQIAIEGSNASPSEALMCSPEARSRTAVAGLSSRRTVTVRAAGPFPLREDDQRAPFGRRAHRLRLYDDALDHVAGYRCAVYGAPYAAAWSWAVPSSTSAIGFTGVTPGRCLGPSSRCPRGPGTGSRPAGTGARRGRSRPRR